jgi:DNA-binding transcriptional MocR family regulator
MGNAARNWGGRQRKTRLAYLRRLRPRPHPSGELCYADEPSRARPDNEMRISFGSASEENIRKGIARLGAVLKKFV